MSVMNGLRGLALCQRGLALTVRMAGLLALAISTAVLALAQQSGYPAPRFPDFPSVVTADDILAAARTFVARKGGGALPGYSIQKGEKVLVLATALYDPRIVDAFARAIREAGATADVFYGDVSDIVGTKFGNGEWGYLENPNYVYVEAGPKYLMRLQLGGGLTPEQVERLVAFNKYAILISGSSSARPGLQYRWEELPWHQPDELLASASFGLPNEVSRMLYNLAWEQLKQARKVRVTDPEGTDLTWSLPPEIEKIPNTPRFWREYMCQPQRLAGRPIESAESMKKVDLNGVISGTVNHVGVFPRITVTVKHNRIVKVDGGGKFGDEWRKILRKYETVNFPGDQPGPGFGWIEECAIGVIPSEVRPRNAASFPLGTYRERRRSGVFHWAFGSQYAQPVAAWYEQTGMPDGHFDVHTNFTTMTLYKADGKKIVFVDKGHMTVLDDPRLREAAARFGDPDKLLHEVWVPPVPGINVPGDYLRDYARDPAAWIAAEHERFFASPQAVPRAQ